MAVRSVLFIHGYSENSLGAYYQFPQILQGDGLQFKQIALSAFDSLDDGVSIDDLAAALEDQALNIARVQGWNFRETAVICHSTGALVARRWILNRLAAGTYDLPSHLITLAGANHGSTLAQMGKSVLGYLQKALSKHVLNVGKRVLTDLDYGSEFLLRLNREWMEEWNSGRLSSKLYAFSLGGDRLGAPGENDYFSLFWQTSEPGSDNTVRISGANLNYALFDADMTATPPVLAPTAITPPVPHLVLAGYSHFGATSGILGNVHARSDPPMVAVLEALGVADDRAYAALQVSWAAATGAWGTANPDRKYATALFTLRDSGGQGIEDCFIGIMNATLAANTSGLTALLAASPAVAPHQPIQNDVQLASYSFYLHYDTYVQSSPHVLHIEAHTPSPLLSYRVLDLMQPAPPPEHLIAPNAFTYFKLTLPKNTDDTYALYALSPTLDLANTAWNPPATPFPPLGRIPLPPKA